MKKWIFTLLTIASFAVVSCEKFQFDKPGDGGTTPPDTDTVYTEVKAEFVKDCTGSYLKIDGNDYKVCNFESTANYKAGDVIYASITKLSECSTISPDQYTCKMAHAYASYIKVRKSELAYRPSTDTTVTKQKMQVVKDCSGTYVKYNDADYQVCNKDVLTKLNNGDWIVASFYKLNECTEKQDDVICMLYHENKGWVKVYDVE